MNYIYNFLVLRFYRLSIYKPNLEVTTDSDHPPWMVSQKQKKKKRVLCSKPIATWF
jgi:hypothetical protein